MTPLLQRLMLRIWRYDMDLQYTPGKSLITDTLSRGLRRKVTQNKRSIHVNLVKKTMPLSDDKWRTIAEETDKDETSHQVKANIINSSIAHCSLYHNFLQELSIIDGVIIKSNRVAVTTSLRGRMLQIIQKGHIGFAKYEM